MLEEVGRAAVLFERRKERAETKGNGLEMKEDKQSPTPQRWE